MKKSFICASLIALSACQTPGANLQANVYHAGQVNQQQAATVVNILAVLPAKIEVSNQQARQTAQLVGILVGGLGAAFLGGGLSHNTGTALLSGAGGAAAGGYAGSLVSDTTLVDGVSLTYEQDGRTLNSAQVGKTCEFQPGKAIIISTGGYETRVQANATCPVTTASS